MERGRTRPVFRGVLLRRLILLWVVALTPLLFWTASMDMFEQPKQLAIKTAAPLIILVFIPPAFPAALSAMLGGLLAFGLASSFLSPLPLYSLFGEYSSYQGLFHWTALAVLLIALSTHLRIPGEGRRFLSAVAASAGLVSVYAFIQVVGLDPAGWSNGGAAFRAFSTAGNPLYMGFLLSAMVPACLGLAMSSSSAGGRSAWLASTLLVFMGTLSSGSRSAVFGAVAGAGLLSFHGVLHIPGKPFPWKLFSGLAAAILALSLAFLPADRNPASVLAGRVTELASGGDSRPVIWAGAGRLVRENPVFGHGLDSFATMHPRVQSPRLWYWLWHASPEKAHNEFMQMAATAGIPATGIIIWLAAWLAAVYWRNRRDPLCATAGAGLAAVSIPALFGFITCGTQSVGLVLAGILASRSRSFVGTPVSAWKILGFILTISLGAHLHFASSLVTLKDAVRDGGTGLDRALNMRTPWAQNLLQAGDTLERGWFGPGLASVPATDGRLAILSRTYASALSANPLNAFCHSAAGRTKFREGKTREAISSYEDARKLAPMDVYLVMEEAQMLLSARRDTEGIALLETAAGMYPRFGEPAGMLGYIWMARKNPSQAEPWLKKAVEGNWYGNNGAAYAAAVNLAVLYRKAGRWIDSSWAESVASKYAPAGTLRP